MRKVRVVRVLIQSVFLFFKKIKFFFVFRGEGGVIIAPPHLGRETYRGEKFFVLKKSKKFYSHRIVSFFENTSFLHYFHSFSKSRTMPQVKHRAANVTSYGLQGAPITLQTDLSVLASSCTQPGAKPTTESEDRKIRPLGYFYGRWHTPPGCDTSLPAFFPPYSESSRVARGSLEKTDQTQKNEKKSKSRTGLL